MANPERTTRQRGPWSAEQLKAHFNQFPPSPPLHEIITQALALKARRVPFPKVEMVKVPSPWPEVEILPEKKLRTECESEAFVNLEFIGPPGLGKTTAINHLRREFFSSLSEVQILMVPNQRDLSLQEMRATIEMAKWELSLDMTHYLFYLYQTQYLNHWLSESLKKMLKAAEEERDPSLTISLIERGPNDMTTFGGAILTWLKENPKAQTLSKEELGNYVRAWIEAMIVHLPRIDAVILFGATRGIGSERRWAEGKVKPGIITDSDPIMERLLNHFGLWLGSFYPYTRDRYGTGLMIVDAEKEEERNLERITQYCQRVIDLKIRGRIAD